MKHNPDYNLHKIDYTYFLPSDVGCMIDLKLDHGTFLNCVRGFCVLNIHLCHSSSTDPGSMRKGDSATGRRKL